MMEKIGTMFSNLWKDDAADDEVVEVDTSVEAAESNDGCRYVILRDKTTRKLYLGVNVSGYEYDDDHVDVSVLPGDDPTKPYSKTVEVKLRAKEFPERFEVIEDHLGCDKDKTYRFKLKKFFLKCRANIDRSGSVFCKERLLPLFELEEYHPRRGAKLPPIS